MAGGLAPTKSTQSVRMSILISENSTFVSGYGKFYNAFSKRDIKHFVISEQVQVLVGEMPRRRRLR